MEKACAISFLLFTLDTQELSSAPSSPWWRTRCCSWRKWRGGSARLLLDCPWTHLGPACGLPGCLPFAAGCFCVSCRACVSQGAHTAPVSSLRSLNLPHRWTRGWGCKGWMLVRGFWRHLFLDSQAFCVHTKVMGELFEAGRLVSKFGRACFGSEEWHLNLV